MEPRQLPDKPRLKLDKEPHQILDETKMLAANQTKVMHPQRPKEPKDLKMDRAETKILSKQCKEKMEDKLGPTNAPLKLN